MGSSAQTHRKALTATGEVPRIEQVEIRLFQRDETDNAVDGAEARTHANRTGCLFFDEHIDVAIAGTAGRTGGLYFAKVLEVIKTGLGGFQLDGVEHITGLERDFAADDLVLGLGIAGDIDAAHAEARTFSHAVSDIHAVRTRIANVWGYLCIGITTGAIVAANHRDIITHLFRRIGRVSRQGEGGIKFFGFEHGHRPKADTCDCVFFTLVDRYDQINFATAGGLPTDARAAGAEVAFAAIVVQNGIQIRV